MLALRQRLQQHVDTFAMHEAADEQSTEGVGGQCRRGARVDASRRVGRSETFDVDTVRHDDQIYLRMILLMIWATMIYFQAVHSQATDLIPD
jgi:hypothetical protein